MHVNHLHSRAMEVRVLDSPQTGGRVAVSRMWVLETDRRSSVRAVTNLNYQAISPVLKCVLFCTK